MAALDSDGRATPGVLEPRYYPRVLLDSAVTVVSERASFIAQAVNVSAGGMAILSTQALEAGESLRLSFALPAPHGHIELDARVVRAGKATDRGRELALVFDALPETAEASIHAFVAERGDIAWESDGSSIPRQVALHFIPLIRRIAKSLAARLPRHVSVDDLIGAGFVQLVELWSRAPMASMQELERVAQPRIRYAMLDELRNNDPLSRRMRDKARRVEEAKIHLETSFGRTPTLTELAQAANMTPADVAFSETLARDASAHLPVAELELADAGTATPEDMVSQNEELEKLAIALEALPPRHRRVLELHYGQHLTLRQVGNLLGVTESRISQLASDAVRRIKASYDDPG